MIVLLEGAIDSGYDLFAISLAIVDSKEEGRKLYSNIDLKNIEYTKLDHVILKDVMLKDGFVGSTILLVDAYSFVDSRQSMSGVNRLMSYLIMSSRPRNVNIYIAVNKISDIDIRIRRNFNVRCKCRYVKSTKLIKSVLMDRTTGNSKVVDIDPMEVSSYVSQFDINKLGGSGGLSDIVKKIKHP